MSKLSQFIEIQMHPSINLILTHKKPPIETKLFIKTPPKMKDKAKVKYITWVLFLSIQNLKKNLK